jgi:hypothetical protein
MARTVLGNIVGASLLLYGSLLVVIVIALPNGVYGALTGRHRKRRLWPFGGRQKLPQAAP